MPGENIQDWSTTALTNGNADSSISWVEGMARAQVNNSARSMMAAIAKDRNLTNGSIVTTGTANVQAFLSGMSYSSVPANLRVLLKIGAGLTNTGAVTLNMDSIGAVGVRDQFSQTLTAGMLKENSYAEFLYNAGAGLWILVNVLPTVTLTNVRKFTASGTYPTSTATVQVLVYAKGGGGGGAGAATGTTAPRGGSGGEGEERWVLTTAATLSGMTVTIGAGGAAGIDGVTGGITSVGTAVAAPGGGGGTRGDFGGAAGFGGTGGTGDFGMPGSPGQFGSDINGTLAFYAPGGGKGGGVAGVSGVANSGGGGGNGSNSLAGGSGGSGIVLCYEYGTI